MTPRPWDWTPVRRQLADLDPARVHALDEALGDLRGHLHTAGIGQPTSDHAEAVWMGARLVLGQLMPALLLLEDSTERAHTQAQIDALEELCCAARDLWPAPTPHQPEPTRDLPLLDQVERLRRDHESPTPRKEP